MNVKTQILIAIIVIIALVIIVNMIRKKRLELKYALAWLGAGDWNINFRLFPNTYYSNCK